MLERLRRGREGGFTLIELLVVVIIIGILAAIAIPAFLGQQEKAEDAGAKAAVRNAATAMETAFTDNRDYTDGTETVLQDIEPTIDFVTTGDGNSTVSPPQVAFEATADTYELRSQAGTGATVYTLAKADTGVVSRSCGTGCTW